MFNKRNMLLGMMVFGVLALALAGCNGSKQVLGGDSFYDAPNVTAIEQGLAKVATPVAVTNDTTNTTVTITLADLVGTAKTGKTLVRCWLSATDGGAPEASSNVTVATGVEIQEVVAEADYWVLTTAAGTASLTVLDAGDTNYFCTSIGGGAISSTPMIFE